MVNNSIFSPRISLKLIEIVTQFSDITFSQIYRELNTKVNGIAKEAFVVHENTTMIVKDNALDPWHTFQRFLMDKGKLILLIPTVLLLIFYHI